MRALISILRSRRIWRAGTGDPLLICPSPFRETEVLQETLRAELTSQGIPTYTWPSTLIKRSGPEIAAKQRELGESLANLCQESTVARAMHLPMIANAESKPEPDSDQKRDRGQR